MKLPAAPVRRLLSSHTVAAVFCLLGCFAVSLLLEVTLFQFRAYEPLLRHASRQRVSAAGFTDLSGLRRTDGGLAVENDQASFTFAPASPTAVYCLRLETEGTLEGSAALTIADHNFPLSGYMQEATPVSSFHPETMTLLLHPSGNVKKITVALSNLSAGCTITGVTLNEPRFDVMWLRVALLTLLLEALLAARRRRRTNPSPRPEHDPSVLTAVWLLGALLAVVLVVMDNYPMVFSSEVQTENDCYQLETDALVHGQLFYRQAPSAELRNFASPYVTELRTQAGFFYLWDSAYYNGRYTSYFGFAPQLLLVPFRLLTGTLMPTCLAVLLFFLLLLAALLALYRDATARWFPDVGFGPWLCGALAVTFAGNLYLLISPANFYELAIASGLFFLALGAQLLLSVWRGASRPTLRLALGGLCLGLTVASRPNLLLYLPAAAVFVFAYFRRLPGRRQRLRSGAAFALPPLCVAAGLMALNAARFGSPFEFGQDYQLTAYDASTASVLNLGLGLTVLHHYLFQPLSIDQNFPFFHFAALPAVADTGWYYCQQMAGLFNYPLLWAAPAGAAVLARTRRGRSAGWWAALLAGLGAALVFWADATKGGAVERYTLDLWPILTLLAVFACFRALQYFAAHGAQRPVARVFCFVALLTTAVSLLSCLSGEFDYRAAYDPVVFHTLTRLFLFWK